MISDFSILLLIASCIALLFRFFKLPLVLAYLLCGLILGPHLGTGKWFQHEAYLHELSHFGTIFLMFYIGLEFDLKKLQQSFGPSVLAVGLQTLFMIALAIYFSSYAQLSRTDTLFLAGILSISSTMLAIPLLTSQGGLSLSYGQLAIGILVLEDFIAILLLVLLTGLAVSGKLEWVTLGHICLLVGTLVITLFFVGRLTVGRLVKILAKAENEILIVVTLALLFCLGEITKNYSVELGAFLAGAILSQTILAKKIEYLTEPFRHLCTAFFFISIGMLIQPKLILENWKAILFLAPLVFLGKFLTCWLGLYLGGQKSLTSLQASAPKAQIGEFSFAIVALGQQAKIIDPRLTAIVAGVFLFTLFLAQASNAYAESIFLFLSRSVFQIFSWPIKKIRQGIKRFSSLFTSYIPWQRYRKPGLSISAYLLLINGILLATACLVHFSDNFLPEKYLFLLKTALWLAAILLSIPAMMSVFSNLNHLILLLLETLEKPLGLLQKPIIYKIIYGIALIASTCFLGLLFFTTAKPSLPTPFTEKIFLGLIGLILVLCFLFWKPFTRFQKHVAGLFLESFHKPLSSTENQLLNEHISWPIQLKAVTLSENARPVGQQISCLQLRKLTGATILAIARQGISYYNPAPQTPLFPLDQLVLLGTSEALVKAENQLSQQGQAKGAVDHSAFSLSQITLLESSRFVSETILSCQLNEQYQINIVGIRRQEELLLPPSPEEMLRANDLLLIAGRTSQIQKFKEELGPSEIA